MIKFKLKYAGEVNGQKVYTINGHFTFGIAEFYLANEVEEEFERTSRPASILEQTDYKILNEVREALGTPEDENVVEWAKKIKDKNEETDRFKEIVEEVKEILGCRKNEDLTWKVREIVKIFKIIQDFVVGRRGET